MESEKSYGQKRTGQERSRQVRPTGSADLSDDHEGGQSGPGGVGGEVRRESERVLGEVGAEGVYGHASLIGGMLRQLIAQQQNQLANAEECIEYHEKERDRALAEAESNLQWYRREQDRCQQLLDNLTLLLEQVDGE